MQTVSAPEPAPPESSQAPHSEAPATSKPWADAAPLALLAALGWLATVLGRGVAPGLRGTAAGLGAIIDVINRVSAGLAQALALTGSVTALLVLVSVTRLSRARAWFKLSSVGLSFIVVGLVLLATITPLGIQASLGLSLSAATLALASAAGGIRQPETRAAALALAAVGIGAGLSAVARQNAVEASAHALIREFYFARIVATGSFVAELVMLGIAVAWLSRRTPRGLAVAGGLAVGALALALVAQRGVDPGASTVAVMLARTFGELARDPAPLVPIALRHMSEALALALVPWALLQLKRQPRTALVLAFALPGRTATDIPLVALLLTLAALVAVTPFQLVAGTKSSAGSEQATPPDQRATATGATAPEPTATEPAAPEPAALPTTEPEPAGSERA